jgi:excinuclease UvrABC helicase subunit UvrB
MSMLDYTDELSKVDMITRLLGDRFTTLEKVPYAVKKIEIEMKEAAIALDFEKAAKLRDMIKKLKFLALEI